MTEHPFPEEIEEEPASGLRGLLFSLGRRRRFSGWLRWVTTPYAAGIAAWTFYAAIFAVIDVYLLSAIFLSAMLGLVFLCVGASPRSDPTRPSLLDFMLSGLSIGAGIHIGLNAAHIVTRIANLDVLSDVDVFFGSALLLLTIEGTRRSIGLGLVVVVLAFLAYDLWGDLLGGVWGHGGVEYVEFIDLLAFTTDGMFGLPTRVAATYAFLFVLFGTFLSRAGGSEFFFNLAATVSGRSPGGPAKIAVVSSGLFGMISGSPASDVVTTGSVTIPMMRRLGYPAHLAGGVEVAASTGGSLLPPVMGSAAFIMVELTGIDYRDIAFAALVPALLYYFCIYAQVHLRSLRLGLAGLAETELQGLRATLGQAPIFVVPLAILVIALLKGFSPTSVAAFGAVSVVVMAVFNRKTRLGLRAIYECLAETTLRMVPVTAAIASAGLVIVGVNMTGLASKFAFFIFLITDRNQFLSLVMAAMVTIILGLGMPTPSAYILAAVLMAPLLVELNIPVLAAHMFLLYYAVLSAMTPPVATAAYVASSIAGGNPLRLAVTACRLSITAFLLPFAFVYSQGLLLQGPPGTIVLEISTAVLGIVALVVALEGFVRGAIAGWMRLAFAAAGLLLLAPGYEADLAGIVLGAGTAAALHLSRRRRMEIQETKG